MAASAIPSGSAVTELLKRVNNGAPDALNSLISAVYAELRRIAASMLRRTPPGQTLQPTALVHEAWLRLNAGDGDWENRAHFFGAAARAMRQVLVAEARHRSAQKRSGMRMTFRDLHVLCAEPDLDVIALEEALSALAEKDQRLARVVELRYFCGLSLEEIVALEGRSLATVKRDQLYARAWLYEYMRGAAQ